MPSSSSALRLRPGHSAWLLTEVNLLCNCGAEATGMFLNERIFSLFRRSENDNTEYHSTMAFTCTVGTSTITAGADWLQPAGRSRHGVPSQFARHCVCVHITDASCMQIASHKSRAVHVLEQEAAGGVNGPREEATVQFPAVREAQAQGWARLPRTVSKLARPSPTWPRRRRRPTHQVRPGSAGPRPQLELSGASTWPTRSSRADTRGRAADA